MLKSERENEIIQILTKRGFVSVRELAEALYASESSIRRDLARLERGGVIKRSHGGAERITSHTNIMPFGRRSYDSVEEKMSIAKIASGIIKEGDVIFLDQSSTAYFLASAISPMKNLTVITNNLEIITLLSKTEIILYSTGGAVFKKNPTCLVGGMTESVFSNFVADIAFFSTGAVGENGRILDLSEEEVFTRKAMLKNAKKKIFLCNSEKIGKSAPYVQCTLGDIDFVISENDSFEKFKRDFPMLKVLHPKNSTIERKETAG
jgi:DeoR/GlpR family transcriptional regulator of sugar metabolism